jgi:hypothetical protein
MLRLAAIVAVAVALAAMPAAALAVQNPFLPQPQTQAPPEQPAPAPAPAPTQEDEPGDLSGATVVVAANGLAARFGVIWVMIIRDARRATAGRSRVRTSRTDPDLAGGARGGNRTQPRGRRLSPAERRRRKRGRAR